MVSCSNALSVSYGDLEPHPQRSTPQQIGLLLFIFFLELAWALNLILAHNAVAHHLDPIVYVSLRLWLSLPVMLVLGHRALQRDQRALALGYRITARDEAQMVLLGILGLLFQPCLYFSGLALSSVSLGVTIDAASLVLTLLISVALGRELLTTGKALAIVLAIAGLLLAVNPLDYEVFIDEGETYLLCSCVVGALFMVLLQPLVQKLPVVFVFSRCTLYATLACVPVLLMRLDSLLQVSTLPPLVWTSCLVSAFMTVLTCAVFSAIQPGLTNKEEGWKAGAAFIVSQPAVLIGAAWLLLGEYASLWVLAGCCMLCLSVVLLVYHDQAMRGKFDLSHDVVLPPPEYSATFRVGPTTDGKGFAILEHEFHLQRQKSLEPKRSLEVGRSPSGYKPPEPLDTTPASFAFGQL